MRPRQCRQDRRHLPAEPTQPVTEQRLLGVDIIEWDLTLVTEREDEHGHVVVQAQPQCLRADLSSHDRDQFVPRPVAGDVEHRHGDTQAALVLRLRSERQPTDSRVQPVGADHQVEMLIAAMGKSHRDMVALVAELLDRVAEHLLDVIRQRVDDDPGQIRAADAHMMGPVPADQLHRVQ